MPSTSRMFFGARMIDKHVALIYFSHPKTRFITSQFQLPCYDQSFPDHAECRRRRFCVCRADIRPSRFVQQEADSESLQAAQGSQGSGRPQCQGRAARQKLAKLDPVKASTYYNDGPQENRPLGAEATALSLAKVVTNIVRLPACLPARSIVSPRK